MILERLLKVTVFMIQFFSILTVIYSGSVSVVVFQLMYLLTLVIILWQAAWLLLNYGNILLSRSFFSVLKGLDACLRPIYTIQPVVKPV